LRGRVQSYTATEKQEITPPDHPAAPPKMSIADFGSKLLLYYPSLLMIRNKKGWILSLMHSSEEERRCHSSTIAAEKWPTG